MDDLNDIEDKKTSKVIWVRKMWRFVLGRCDALDDGWTHNGKLISTRINVWRSSNERPAGVGFFTRYRSYVIYYEKE